MGTLLIPFKDYGGDSSTVRLNVDNAITDPNITTLQQAVQDVTLGNAGQVVLRTDVNKDVGPGGQPANAFAQRETKWLVKYHDATTLKNYQLEIPNADLAHLSAGTETMDLSAGDGLTLKNQIEAFVEAPLTGNAVVVDEVVFVARNL